MFMTLWKKAAVKAELDEMWLHLVPLALHCKAHIHKHSEKKYIFKEFQCDLGKVSEQLLAGRGLKVLALWGDVVETSSLG